MRRFSTTPGCGDSDLRMVYCAFAISSMLGDWRGVDVSRALEFIRRCRVRYTLSFWMLAFKFANGVWISLLRFLVWRNSCGA